MDTTNAQGILISAAGLLYACLGFSLSVIAALYNLLNRRSKAPSDLILALPSHSGSTTSPTPRVRQPIRSFSDKQTNRIPPRLLSEGVLSRSFSEKGVVFSESPPSSPFQILRPLPTGAEKVPEPLLEKHKRRFHHQRSHSIPAILVDNFDSSEYITWNSADHLDAERRPPVHIEDASPPSTINPIRRSSTTHFFCDGKSRPRIFNPKSWGKDKKSKTLKRCRSSPQLYTGPFLPVPAPNQPASTGSDVSAEANLKKTKSWKSLRKARSSITDKPAPKPETRKAEKKKSQTLRTHPYEAPYFAPHPVPSMPVKITFISDRTTSDSSSPESSPKSSLDKKLPMRRFSKS